MPAGSLKEKRFDSPTWGVLSRENSSRRYVQASVTVPTVERALPPILRWSMTTTGVRPPMCSTGGRVHFASRFLANGGKVSLSWCPASAAIVSKTSEDLPDPDTPTKTTSRLRGMSRSMPARLFVRARRRLMFRCVIPARLRTDAATS